MAISSGEHCDRSTSSCWSSGRWLSRSPSSGGSCPLPSSPTSSSFTWPRENSLCGRTPPRARGRQNLRPRTEVSPERRARWLPRGETRQKVESALIVYRKLVASIEDADDVTRAVLDDAVPKLHAAADRLVDVGLARERAAEAASSLPPATDTQPRSPDEEDRRGLEEVVRCGGRGDLRDHRGAERAPGQGRSRLHRQQQPCPRRRPYLVPGRPERQARSPEPGYGPTA